MAGENGDAVKRIGMIFPGTVGVVGVPEDQVEHFQASGWQRVRGGGQRRADTGSVPVQRSQQ